MGGVAYAVGASGAPDKADAAAEKNLSYEQAKASAEKAAYEKAMKDGRQAGRKIGISQGKERGSKTGKAEGTSEREAQAQARAQEEQQSASERNLENVLKYGCDPEYIFPDGTNGCTHDYGPRD